MRIVDVRNIKSVATCYSRVPQPMYVYHSQEEFESNVPIDERRTIESAGDYFEFLMSEGINTDYDPNNKFIDLQQYNLWVKTVDKFIPDYANYKGDIFYVVDDNGDFIPTDSVWIQFFFLLPTPTKHVLFTSSGVHTVGMSKWDLTGAERQSFIQERGRSTKGKGYEQRLERLMKKKKPHAPFFKLVMALMLDNSETFLDIDRSVYSAFGYTVKKDDRIKLLSSPAFRSAMLQTFKTIYPSLKEKLRETHDPDKMSEMMKTMWEIAKTQADEDGDISQLMKIFDKVKEVGYEEITEVEDGTRPQIPLVGGRKTAGNLTEAHSLPDPNSFGNDDETDESSESSKEKKKKAEEEEEFQKMELDYPASYVRDSEEKEKED